MGLFDGKVAIITGAGAGIGRSHALAFAKEGAKVVVNDLGSDRGRVDILVNNAGVLRDRAFLNMSDADWDLVNSVHLKGTFYCSQLVGRHLKVEGKGGRIINTTSVSGLMGNFGQANYAAAKAGIYGFTRTLAIELAKANVTVNAIAPMALTRMTEDLPMFKGLTPEQIGPQFISPAVLFLASDFAADITGQVLGVEGPRLFIYRMEKTDGLEKDPKRGYWTAQEIRESWGRISGQ